MKKQQFGVIGLGRFGTSLATELYNSSHDVLAVDLNEEVVKSISPSVTYAVQADGSDIAALKAIGISNMDVVIVALARDISASLLTALNAIELGIPKIYAKAYTESHAKILYKIGVSKVYFPETEMGQRVALELCNDNLLELIDLDDKHSIAEILAPSLWAGKSIAQINIRKKYGITIMLIKNKNDIIVSPSPDEIIRPDSQLLVLGEVEQIQNLRND
jgi:trk system potassium uptake protein TrkA